MNPKRAILLFLVWLATLAASFRIGTEFDWPSDGSWRWAKYAPPSNLDGSWVGRYTNESGDSVVSRLILQDDDSTLAGTASWVVADTLAFGADVSGFRSKSGVSLRVSQGADVLGRLQGRLMNRSTLTGVLVWQGPGSTFAQPAINLVFRHVDERVTEEEVRESLRDN